MSVIRDPRLVHNVPRAPQEGAPPGLRNGAASATGIGEAAEIKQIKARGSLATSSNAGKSEGAELTTAVVEAVIADSKAPSLSNESFLRALFTDGAATWVCAFPGVPGSDAARWGGRGYIVGRPLSLDPSHNTYFSTAELKGISGGRRKANFARMQVLVADDPDVSALRGVPTYVVRTSDDKRQVGLVIKDTPESRDPELCDRALKAMVAQGLMKADKSGNNLVRYVRLPVGVNTKYPHHPAHALEQWNPGTTYTLDEALAAFGVDDWRSAGLAAPATATSVDDNFDFDAPGRLNVEQAEAEVISGESLHQNLIRLAAHYAARGLGYDDILALLLGLMDRSLTKGTDRHAQRLAALPATVRSAIVKFGESYAAKVDFTDTGNVNLLAQLLGGDLRFVPETKTWIRWSGGRWEADSTGACAFAAAKAVAEHYSTTIARLQVEQRGMDRDAAKRHQKVVEAYIAWERQCRGRRALENMVALASKDGRFVVGLDQLDTDPWLLGVQNGVVDLRTGALRPDAKDEFVTQRCAVAFKPGADYARWDLLITEVTGKPLDVEYSAAGVLSAQSVGRYTPRPAYANYLKRALGYSITGVTREHKMFTVYGEHGANGKNLVSDTIRRVLGDYAGKAKPELLMTSRRSENDANRASPALVALRNKRFVEMSEPRVGCTFDNATVKSLTGDATLAARANYAVTEGSVNVCFKLWLLANLKPPVDHMEQAVVGRLVMMPFDRQWNRPGTVDRNPELPDADKHLEETLLAAGEGVLAWLVEGAVEYHQRGLEPCDEVIHTTKEYFREQEPVLKWINEHGTCSADVGGKAADLFEAFSRWRAGREAVGALTAGTSPLTQTAFSKKLAALGIEKTKDAGGYVRYGVRLVEAVEFEAAPANDLAAEICRLGLEDVV